MEATARPAQGHARVARCAALRAYAAAGATPSERLECGIFLIQACNGAGRALVTTSAHGLHGPDSLNDMQALLSRAFAPSAAALAAVAKPALRWQRRRRLVQRTMRS